MCCYKQSQGVCISILGCHIEYCLEFVTYTENLLKVTRHLGVRIGNCFAILTCDIKYLSIQRTHFKHWRQQEFLNTKYIFLIATGKKPKLSLMTAKEEIIRELIASTQLRATEGTEMHITRMNNRYQVQHRKS